MNTNDKMMELKDVVVTIKGEEINLGDLTYHDFAEMMDTLSDDEAKALLDTVVATIGEENFIKFIGKLQMLADMEDEEEVPVSVVEVIKKCDCGGEFEYTPGMTQTLEYPPHYTHTCNKCGKVERFLRTYPYQKYKRTKVGTVND